MLARQQALLFLRDGSSISSARGAAAGMALLMACRAAKKGLRPPRPQTLPARSPSLAQVSSISNFVLRAAQ